MLEFSVRFYVDFLFHPDPVSNRNTEGKRKFLNFR